MSSIDFSTLTQKIAALLAAHPEQPVLIALDGRCGSGKTTLAGQLAEQFPASIVFHTDDYYLPPDQRWGHAAWQLRAAYEQATKLQYE